MRCYIHEFQDAIGNCESCGQPICNDCAERRDGKFYCPNCTGSDWLESESTPSTSGSEKQYSDAVVDTKLKSGLFTIGGIGALIAMVSSSLSLLPFFLAISGLYFDYSSVVIILIGVAVLSQFSMLLMSAGFYGFYVNYENQTGRVVAFLGIISTLFGVVSIFLTPAVYALGATRFGLQQAGIIDYLLISLIVGFVAMILSLMIGISLYQVRNVIGNQNLATITAILVLATVFLGWYGTLIAPFTYLLLAILFFQAKMPETDGWLAKSKTDHTW